MEGQCELDGFGEVAKQGKLDGFGPGGRIG